MEEAIDEELVNKKNDEPNLFGVIRWWEKKRLLYNAIVFGIQLACMLIYLPGTIDFGISMAIIGSLLFLLAANLFYCIGWGGEMLLIYYLKIGDSNTDGRMAFFIFGVAFSGLVTVSMYLPAIN